MEFNILNEIQNCLEDSKDWIPQLEGAEWKIQEDIATNLIAKNVILKLIEKLHSIDSLREKEKFELEIIISLGKIK